MNKILFVVPSFSGGGAERVVSVLASELADCGYETSVIIYHKAEKEYPYSSKLKIYNLSGGTLECYEKMGMLPKVKKLRLLIRTIQPDYIVPFLPQVGFHVWLATLGKAYKIVQTVRNNPETDPPVRYQRWIRNCMLLFSWRNFVQNEDQLNYFPRIIKRKTTVLPNPVSNEVFQYNHEYRNNVRKIVAMGRLAAQKNFELFIQAAAKVHAVAPDVEFYIYGEGELSQKLMNDVEQLHLSECFFLPGRTQEPYKMLDSADIFVLSSDYEGMPNALMEAMALGLPSISTDCPTGPADIIVDKINGRLIATNDVDALAEKMLEWIESPQQLKEVGTNAKATINQRFSARAITDRFLREVLKTE